MPRVAALFEIPTPYRHPILTLIQSRSDLDTDFFFLGATQSDRPWRTESFADLRATYIPGKQLTFPGHHTIHLNWHVMEAICGRSYDAFVLGGYAQPALIRLLRHCWKERLPYVTVTESHLKKKRSLWVRMIKDPFVRRVYERSGANLVMGSASADYVKHYGALPDSVHLFPNTIDGPAFAEKVERFRREGRKPAGNILFVGTLNARKGVDLLLRAFVGVAQRFPNARLRYVGKGTMEAWLRKQVSRQGVQGRISFEGYVQPDDLPRLYADADLFVLPSREEPFGAVICEAMAASLPVVASSAVGAADDFIRDGVNGRIFPSADEAALMRSLGEILGDESVRKRMGERSRTMMMEWTHRRLADSFVSAVNAAVQSRASSEISPDSRPRSHSQQPHR